MRIALPLLVLPLALVACKKPDAAAAAAKEDARPVKVQVAPVADRAMPEYLTVTGSLKASEESDLAADASGKVLATFVERGQKVKRGEILAVLDSRGAALTQTAAEAQAQLAKSQLEQARKDCERVKHLFDSGAISQAEFDRQNTACTSGQWSLAAAEAQQQNAAKLLGDSRIRAPFDGYVGERFVNVGQYVSPSTRIASVYKPDPLRLELTIPEAQLAALKQELPVGFRVAAFGDTEFKGAIRYISPNVRPATRDLIVEALVSNGDGRLRPGMFAVARLPLPERTSPVVPLGALLKEESGTRVFIVVERRLQERVVQLGEERDGLVAVLKGLQSGESLVVQPGPDARDGARVE